MFLKARVFKFSMSKHRASFVKKIKKFRCQYKCGASRKKFAVVKGTQDKGSLVTLIVQVHQLQMSTSEFTFTIVTITMLTTTSPLRCREIVLKRKTLFY